MIGSVGIQNDWVCLRMLIPWSRDGNGKALHLLIVPTPGEGRVQGSIDKVVHLCIPLHHLTVLPLATETSHSQGEVGAHGGEGRPPLRLHPTGDAAKQQLLC